MFNIDRGALGATVRCQDCPATLTVDSDHKQTVDRSIKAFEARHHCRPINARDRLRGEMEGQ